MGKTKRDWKEVIRRAIGAFKSGKYVYFYGAKDIELTMETMKALVAHSPAYFARYSSEEMAQIYRNSLGKRGIDCSGFTGWICTGDERYSIGQIENCSKYNSLAAGPTASILFTTWGGTGRHIGLDIGNGYTLQAGWESTDAAIREGRAGIILRRMDETAWERSGESNCVNYTGAYSPYEPTTELIKEVYGGDIPTPETWVGEAYGLAIVPVYKDASRKELLPEWSYLGAGNLFDVYGEAGELWYIRIAGKYYGYIPKVNCLRKTPKYKAHVITDLNLRVNAGSGYKSICVMRKGEEVQVCDEKPARDGKPWKYVIYKGTYGFCSAYYVK